MKSIAPHAVAEWIKYHFDSDETFYFTETDRNNMFLTISYQSSYSSDFKTLLIQYTFNLIQKFCSDFVLIVYIIYTGTVLVFSNDKIRLWILKTELKLIIIRKTPEICIFVSSAKETFKKLNYSLLRETKVLKRAE